MIVFSKIAKEKFALCSPQGSVQMIVLILMVPISITEVLLYIKVLERRIIGSDDLTIDNRGLRNIASYS